MHPNLPKESARDGQRKRYKNRRRQYSQHRYRGDAKKPVKPKAKSITEADVKKAFNDDSKTLKQKAAIAIAHWLGILPGQNKLLRVQHALRYENLLKLLNYDVFGIHNDKETLKKMLKEYKVKYDEICAGQFNEAKTADKLFKKFSKVFHPD